MSDPVTIVIPWDVQRLSPNQRIHHWERARRAKSAKAAARMAWHLAGEPVLAGPVEVSLLIRRARVIDRDNAIAGFKSCADGLFNRRANGYGVVDDDRAALVRYGTVEFETGKCWQYSEAIIVTITPVETE